MYNNGEHPLNQIILPLEMIIEIILYMKDAPYILILLNKEIKSYTTNRMVDLSIDNANNNTDNNTNNNTNNVKDLVILDKIITSISKLHTDTITKAKFLKIDPVLLFNDEIMNAIYNSQSIRTINFCGLHIPPGRVSKINKRVGIYDYRSRINDFYDPNTFRLFTPGIACLNMIDVMDKESDDIMMNYRCTRNMSCNAFTLVNEEYEDRGYFSAFLGNGNMPNYINYLYFIIHEYDVEPHEFDDKFISTLDDFLNTTDTVKKIVIICATEKLFIKANKLVMLYKHNYHDYHKTEIKITRLHILNKS